MDPFGNKAGEAVQGGFKRLSLALVHGWQEQVRFLLAASVWVNLGACSRLWHVFSEQHWDMGDQQVLLSVGLWPEPETQASCPQKVAWHSLGLEAEPLV
jgi:hypothetical protein